jgi:hypothetical protein
MSDHDNQKGYSDSVFVKINCAKLSVRNLTGGKGWLARKADLTAICEPIF